MLKKLLTSKHFEMLIYGVSIIIIFVCVTNKDLANFSDNVRDGGS